MGRVAEMYQEQQDNDLEYGWTEEAKEEYEQYCREQKDLPPWQVTKDDFLESQK